AEGGWAASESEPSAATSSSGCARTRSSVSWPAYPEQPTSAVVNICAYYADQAPIMQTSRPAKLVLEDGTVFGGSAVGAPGVAAGEACFTTAMAGYEEAASDPSYMAQVLAFSYPLVGNYGVDAARSESERVQAEGIVMRKARPAWAQWLASQGVLALEDVDTRALVRRIRDGGVLRCALGEAPVEEL